MSILEPPASLHHTPCQQNGSYRIYLNPPTYPRIPNLDLDMLDCVLNAATTTIPARVLCSPVSLSFFQYSIDSLAWYLEPTLMLVIR